ncbi:tail fiber protein [Streptomyces sp. NBC_01485]
MWLSAGSRAGGIPAKGQLMSITENQPLYSLLGTTYGGNGTTTFQLPDLRSAAPNGLTYVICAVGVYPWAD